MVPGFFMPVWLTPVETLDPEAQVSISGWTAHHMIHPKGISPDLRLHWDWPLAELAPVSPGLYPMHLLPLRMLISSFSWQYTINVVMTAIQGSVSSPSSESPNLRVVLGTPNTPVWMFLSLYLSEFQRLHFCLVSVSISISMSRTHLPGLSVFHFCCLTLFSISSRHLLFLVIWQPELQLPPLSWCKPHSDYFLLIFIYLFIWSCSMWSLRPRIKPTSPALEVWSPNQWTAREALHFNYFYNNTTKWGF